MDGHGVALQPGVVGFRRLSRRAASRSGTFQSGPIPIHPCRKPNSKARVSPSSRGWSVLGGYFHGPHPGVAHSYPALSLSIRAATLIQRARATIFPSPASGGKQLRECAFPVRGKGYILPHKRCSGKGFALHLDNSIRPYPCPTHSMRAYSYRGAAAWKFGDGMSPAGRASLNEGADFYPALSLSSKFYTGLSLSRYGRTGIRSRDVSLSPGLLE